MEKLNEMLLIIGVFILTLIVIGVILSIPTMLLWNWLIPPIFGLTTITFKQAFGLIILSSILFKSSK